MKKTQRKKRMIFLLTILMFMMLQSISYGKTDDFGEKEKRWMIEALNFPNQLTMNEKQIDETKHLLLFQDPSEKDRTGYMLIVKEDDSEQILEYGYGKQVPYQLEIIIDESIQNLEPKSFIYHNPIESVWLFQIGQETVYFDGATGERLPDLKDKIKNISIQDLGKISDTIGDSLLNFDLLFDPYINIGWILDTPSSLTKTELIQSLNNGKQILFSGKKYDQQVLFAWSVLGYQWISDQLYIAVYDSLLEVTRFIPYSLLEEYGTFSLFESGK